MTQILEVWADTGIAIERDRNVEEQAQYEADEVLAVKVENDRVKKEAADQSDKKAAIEHAKTLGFTSAMIAVMYANLGA